MRVLIALAVSFCLLSVAPVSTGARARGVKATASQNPASTSPGAELPRGRVVEKVTAARDPSQSYALYLPTYYTPERSWPILYCFDPLGRGAVPVERFRDAAEKYGWVVAGSNNSRNGPLRPALVATEVLWDDTHARLALDDRRVYAAGFSGGARHAVRVNHLCRNCLAGVIACGAGFPPDVTPSASAPFALFGMAGANDFNFPELKLLDEQLAKLSFPHRFEVFDGGHAWAPAELCTTAVEWMELQAMKSKRREADKSLLEQLWKKAAAKAADSEAAGEVYEAYKGYRALADDFAGLRDTAEAERKAAELKGRKEVRKARDEEDRQVGRQQKLAGELLALLAPRADADQRAAAMNDFRRAVADLRKAARGPQDSGERRVARRTLGQVFALHYEAAANLRARGEGTSPVVLNLEVAAEIAPDNPQVLFELAGAYAANREKRKALDALRRAVENGFKDADALAASEALAPLRAEAAFKEIVNSLSPKR